MKSCDHFLDLLSLPSEACTLFVAMATKPGHTQVVLRLNSGGVSLETSVTIAAYPPLKVFYINKIVRVF